METEGVFFIFVLSSDKRCSQVVNPCPVIVVRPRMDFFVLSQECRQTIESDGSKQFSL